MSKIAVLGSGGWGIALAMTAEGCGHSVSLWSPFENEVAELNLTRESKKLLSGVKIPETITITTDLSVADNADIIIIAVPSLAVRETAARLKAVKNFGIVVNVAKGIEKDSLKRLSEVIKEEVPGAKVVVLSGPSHAEEVARCVPTSLVAASEDEQAAETVIKALSGVNLRIYSNSDVTGVELGGAFKNIIAVASGFCDGMGLGDNTRAALITRGLTEIARLGVACGARENTFAGLTGLGDLVVTCTSRHSRNHRFGEMVGKGAGVTEALAEVGTVEGYHATKMAYQLAKKMGVEMPITEQCYKVLYLGDCAPCAVKELMLRPSKDEHEALWLK